MATSVRLENPRDVSVAEDGAIYICEEGGSRIRRVGPDGIINTIAGNGASGHGGDGGPASSATLASPSNIALGSDGSVYIAENAAIRRVGPDGIISTIAGNGTAGYS